MSIASSIEKYHLIKKELPAIGLFLTIGFDKFVVRSTRMHGELLVVRIKFISLPILMKYWLLFLDFANPRN